MKIKCIEKKPLTWFFYRKISNWPDFLYIICTQNARNFPTINLPLRPKKKSNKKSLLPSSSLFSSFLLLFLTYTMTNNFLFRFSFYKYVAAMSGPLLLSHHDHDRNHNIAPSCNRKILGVIANVVTPWRNIFLSHVRFYAYRGDIDPIPCWNHANNLLAGSVHIYGIWPHSGGYRLPQWRGVSFGGCQMLRRCVVLGVQRDGDKLRG